MAKEIFNTRFKLDDLSNTRLSSYSYHSDLYNWNGPTLEVLERTIGTILGIKGPIHTKWIDDDSFECIHDELGYCEVSIGYGDMEELPTLSIIEKDEISTTESIYEVLNCINNIVLINLAVKQEHFKDKNIKRIYHKNYSKYLIELKNTSFSIKILRKDNQSNSFSIPLKETEIMGSLSKINENYSSGNIEDLIRNFLEKDKNCIGFSITKQNSKKSKEEIEDINGKRRVLIKRNIDGVDYDIKVDEDNNINISTVGTNLDVLPIAFYNMKDLTNEAIKMKRK